MSLEAQIRALRAETWPVWDMREGAITANIGQPFDGKCIKRSFTVYHSPRQEQTTQLVQHALAGVWEHDDPLASAEVALRKLLPAQTTAIYTVDDAGELERLHSNLPQAEAAARDLLEAGLQRYRFKGRDPFANHAVDDTVLYAEDPEGYAAFRAHVRAHDLEVDHTLRVVVQHDDRTCGWIGFMRDADRGRFVAEDRAVLQRVVPQIESIVTAGHVLDAGRLRGLDLQVVLDTFDEPALLCGESGQILLANARARKHYAQTPDWLEACARAGSNAMAKVSPVRIDDRKLLLVVPRPIRTRSQEIQQGPSASDLPPYLAAVVELMLEGLTDREIADKSGRSYNTVRTYVRRLYARYGVSNRMQLLRALGK